MALGAMVAYCIYELGVELDKDQDEMKINVGKEVIIEGDTLVITNYSTWNGEYYLNNGVTISKEFLNN